MSRHKYEPSDVLRLDPPATMAGPPVCRWFAKCTRPAPQQVEHPTLGWVNICDECLAWLGPNPSPTQFVPPLAADVLDRNPAARAIILTHTTEEGDTPE
jgi:hypothetical protein